MHPQIRTLLNELKTLVLSHPTVRRAHIRGEEVTASRGYLRMRLVLQFEDEVEAFVYVDDENGTVRLADYSLHWQRGDGALVQRWDTAPHYRELEGFPYHTHTATGEVEPTDALDWDGFIALLQKEILAKSGKKTDA